MINKHYITLLWIFICLGGHLAGSQVEAKELVDTVWNSADVQASSIIADAGADDSSFQLRRRSVQLSTRRLMAGVPMSFLGSLATSASDYPPESLIGGICCPNPIQSTARFFFPMLHPVRVALHRQHLFELGFLTI